MSKITVEDFDRQIRDELAWAHEIGITTVELGDGTAKLHLPFSERIQRPGPTVSGPTMMTFCDLCMYATIQTVIGEVKMAVTTNFNINFLKMTGPVDLIAEGSILKQGKRLVIMEVSLYPQEDPTDCVAHATATFSVPPQG